MHIYSTADTIKFTNFVIVLQIASTEFSIAGPISLQKLKIEFNKFGIAPTIASIIPIITSPTVWITVLIVSPISWTIVVASSVTLSITVLIKFIIGVRMLVIPSAIAVTTVAIPSATAFMIPIITSPIVWIIVAIPSQIFWIPSPASPNALTKSARATITRATTASTPANAKMANAPTPEAIAAVRIINNAPTATVIAIKPPANNINPA